MQSQDIISWKLRRLRDGQKPRFLDLFAGCGGFSLGFHATGFEPVGAVEKDILAARSHGVNFFPGSPVHRESVDITQIEPAEYLQQVCPGEQAERAVDVIIGGPPCQAFARVGRAKLREIIDHPEAYRQDERGRLYLRYLDFVRALKPVALVMENVIDMLNYGGHNVPQEICETLETLGYVPRYAMLNAVHFGVPQMRERLFLVAIARELDVTPRFPTPSHWWELATGYDGARRVALRTGRTRHYLEPDFPRPGLLKAVTAREALADLPPIMALALLEAGALKKGPTRFTRSVPYRRGGPTAYARQMRSWDPFEAGKGINDHVIRVLPLHSKLFSLMKPGEEYPQAHARGLAMFEDMLREEREAGRALRKGGRRYEELNRRCVPKYNPFTFPNRWRKMEPDAPARTLMAHLGKDCYTHIHYDSEQARTISVREAARLQSFPDGFRFEGTMNPAFRQIGNAVPPLLARAVAAALLDTLQDALSRCGPVQLERELVTC